MNWSERICRKPFPAILSAIGIYVLTNGYRFFNPLFSGDALLMLYQDDAGWQIALGRFVQPFLVYLRGAWTSPFLISILAAVLIGLSAAVVSEYFGERRVWAQVLLGGVMGASETFIAANANFLPWVDLYAVSLLLAVLGIRLIGQGRAREWIAGTVLLVISIGIYQAYLGVAVGMMMLRWLFDLADGGSAGTVLRKLGRYFACFLAAALLYYAVWKGFQSALHIWTSDSYNGLASVGDYSETSVPSLLALTYRNVLDGFLHPVTFVTIPFRGLDTSRLWRVALAVCNLSLIGWGVCGWIRRNLEQKTGPASRILQTVILLLFPLGINLVCFLSKGMEHTLMTYAFFLAYVPAIRYSGAPSPGISRVGASGTPPARRGRMSRMTILGLSVLLGALVWSHIVYANQVYLKKEMQETAARNLMTRILYAVEASEGYQPGATPVAFSGSFERSEYVVGPEGAEALTPWGNGDSAFSYMGTEYAYLRYFESVPMNLIRVDAHLPEVEAMPCYPEDGAIAYVDGVLVVKLSEW